ncbi:diguanylate cyclase/phosphodiesterase (GGDEF & EAL domains) with PAS/PAC sensor [Minicystis rosea]|nr:diguanylate cyclase/phosphodiesterase (GGDEF & EAL domains) with PAS/PAC sensor [Minicystis rosea]
MSRAAKRRTPRSDEIARLRAEVASLRGAVELLHRIGILVGGELELEPACYAVLTATTAGVGLGLNRAMLFLSDPADPDKLRGVAAVGPIDRAEADRVWRSIEAAAQDLETLYESGLRHHRSPGALDRRVREVVLDAHGRTPVALACQRNALVVREGDDAGGLFHPATAIAAPIHDGRGICGALYADDCFTARRLEPVCEMVFRMVADHAGRAIANARRFEAVAGAARTDALTGLRHHGAFMTDLSREIDAARARRGPLGLAMIDLDGFKHINDTLGHLSGDALLAGLAQRMRGVVRGGEGIYRYGGDEFAALVPGADAQAMALVGARLREAVAGQPFALGDGKRASVTCSIGVASLPEDADGGAALVEAADRAMFRAKASGKDAVSAVR